MDEPLEISRVEEKDVPAIHRIEQDSFPAPWRRAFFVGELTAPGRFNLVAKKRGIVIGYLFAMCVLDEMHVNKIAVAEYERRQGVADALMARCFAFARENAIRTIALEVRQSNSAAHDFYRQLDFKPTYVRPRYYSDGEAALVMVREL